MNYGLDVGASPKAMTARFKAGAQLAMVVDLSVEDDGGRSFLIEDWLVSARYVDDAEAAKGEARIGEQLLRAFIRPAMRNRKAHKAKRLLVGRFPSNTRNAAHQVEG
jgi:hypothetical protein